MVNTYGLSEFGEIGFEYRCGNMHLMDENVFAEIVQTSDDPFGEIVVTHLKNTATPLIRYRTGDMATSISEGCSCSLGLRVLKDLKGRAHDFILRPNGGVVHGQFFTHLFVYREGIKKYQVIQEAIDRLHIKLVVDERFDKRKNEAFMLRILREQLHPDLKVTFSYPSEIPVEASGKYRWIISRVGQRSPAPL